MSQLCYVVCYDSFLLHVCAVCVGVCLYVFMLQMNQFLSEMREFSDLGSPSLSPPISADAITSLISTLTEQAKKLSKVQVRPWTLAQLPSSR